MKFKIVFVFDNRRESLIRALTDSFTSSISLFKEINSSSLFLILDSVTFISPLMVSISFSVFSIRVINASISISTALSSSSFLLVSSSNSSNSCFVSSIKSAHSFSVEQVVAVIDWISPPCRVSATPATNRTLPCAKSFFFFDIQSLLSNLYRNKL